jgi:hypothetical protein
VRFVRRVLLAFLILVAMPLGVNGAVWWSQPHAESWRAADWSSTHTLPDPAIDGDAMVRIYSARTGRWKGIFATHSWIVLKEPGGQYERWDKVGWGSPVRRNGYPPDARWYSNEPRVLWEARGARAEALIPRMRAAIRGYAYANRGDYNVWPGPNSNTFVAAVLAAVPQAQVSLPPTAIGKDFPVNGEWIGPTPSGTGFKVTLGGYAGLTLAWIEGFEINILGAVVGLDFHRPALKLPGIGRVGVS